MIYKRILKPLLFLFNPEFVHKVFVWKGIVLGSNPVTRKLVDMTYGYHGKNISKTVDGITYRTPIILSAGFDYNGHLTRVLPSLGFGGVEVGSVTARPCKGNSSPTLTRIPNSHAIIVNKGLKNDGVDKIIKRLKSKKRIPEFVIGISIAKTNDMQCANTDEAIKDYCYSFKRLNEENIGDYYTINIYCPNTYGGEAFTQPDLLERLLFEIKKIPCTKPIYIKMPINIFWEETKSLLDIILKYQLNGVIFGNLNKNYLDIPHVSERPPEYRGGISGKPCFHPSNILIEKTKKEYGNKLTIIGCGGIFTPIDALYKFELGSELIQVITGMIYEGPSLIKRICKEYASSCHSREGGNPGSRTLVLREK
jgi:dihydroorotate dehydrogenase subfamily 2